MSATPMQPQTRPELPPMPRQMQSLPVDKRGYPVPWFVEWINGEPEFRAMNPDKFMRAIQERLCWVCGQELYAEIVFVIGPMCALNRISSEPPSHRQCAQYSARACPFLSKPQMHRRDDETFNNAKKNSAGVMIERNPGVTLLWFTRNFELLRSPSIPEAGAGAGLLFKIGKPFLAEWYCQGRPATRAEVMDSINSGIPLLYEANARQGIDEAAGRAEIEPRLADTMRLVPKH